MGKDLRTMVDSGLKIFPGKPSHWTHDASCCFVFFSRFNPNFAGGTFQFPWKSLERHCPGSVMPYHRPSLASDVVLPRRARSEGPRRWPRKHSRRPQGDDGTSRPTPLNWTVELKNMMGITKALEEYISNMFKHVFCGVGRRDYNLANRKGWYEHMTIWWGVMWWIPGSTAAVHLIHKLLKPAIKSQKYRHPPIICN